MVLNSSGGIFRSGIIRLNRKFQFQFGSSIPHIDVAYQMVGKENAPIIFIAPSMSHSFNVTRSLTERLAKTGVKGWWEKTVGWGDEFGVDLNNYQILSASPLGSPHSTTSPACINPATNREYRLDFPLLTPHDQARCHTNLMEELGIKFPLHAMIGSSMGGMAVIEAMIQKPDISQLAVVIATTGQTSPSTQALRSVQRDAVRMDPNFQNGNYAANARPDAGMKIARKIGTIAYRSRQEFDARFQSRPNIKKNNNNSNNNPPSQSQMSSSGNLSFPVDNYLEHQSASFGSRYDACCYLRLSECMDLQDISRPFNNDYETACKQISQSSEWLMIPVTEDALIPAHELDRFAATLGKLGVKVQLARLSSPHGHDAFLTQSSAINWQIRSFLSGGVDGVRQSSNEYNGQSI